MTGSVRVESASTGDHDLPWTNRVLKHWRKTMRSYWRILRISVLSLMLLASMRAQDQNSVPAPVVPSAIQVPGNPPEADFLGYATGTQNYTCNSTGHWPASGHPDATLSDANGVVFAITSLPVVQYRVPRGRAWQTGASSLVPKWRAFPRQVARQQGTA